jgi:hypothetical protein
MKAKIAGFLLLGILLFSHCSKEPETGLTFNNLPGDTVEVIIPAGDEQYLQYDSDYIFDQEKLLTFHLDLPDANLDYINADPTAEKYVEGKLTFEGESISPVGIRYKGSVGAFVGCLSGSNWANPSGFKTCTKLSMKIKINWSDSSHKFYGLKKLQFHSQNLDPTQMHERLGYWLFGAMGVPTPRCVHAKLMINGEYSGLYALTEQIDGRFADYHFDNGDGNIYKEIWPVDMDGAPWSAYQYIDHLKTNEEDTPSVAIMRSFGEEIEASDETSIKNVIINRMDLDEIISYAVVDRAIRHDDGPFHWYCGGNNCDNHNYYWYEDPVEETLHLIPWDLDNAFENIIYNMNAVTPIADNWGSTSNDCEPFPYGLLGFYQRSAACDKLIAGWASFTEEYNESKNEFKQGPFSEETVNTLLDSWSEQIRDATIEASVSHFDALKPDAWENALDELKEQLEYARKK